MLGLGKFLHTQPGQVAKDDTQLVTTLVQRVGESLVIEDRRTALNELRDVLTDDPSAQAAFASLGFNTICTALQNDISDPIIVRTALECIAAATTGNTDRQQSSQTVNAEQLARTNGAIQLITSLLDHRAASGIDAFHIKYLSLQTIHSMLIANLAYTQQAILNIPISVSLLVEVLGEQQEVLRNEAVLVMQRLVHDNSEAQKVAVFNGCLDKAFAIMKEEDVMMGGIIVEDCLRLVTELIKNNESNHRMFHELGFYSALVISIEEQVAIVQQHATSRSEDNHSSNPDTGMGYQEQQGFSIERNNNIASAIALLEACIADAAMVHVHDVVHALPLSAITALATSRGVATNVRASAWSCLCAALKTGFLSIQTLGNLPVGSIHAFWAGYSLEEQAAAADFSAAALKDNPSGQTMIASMLIQSALTDPRSSILAGLYSPGSIAEQLTGSRAAVALSPLIVSNTDVKQLLLQAQIPQQKMSTLAACAQRLAVSVTMHGAKPEGQLMVGNYSMLLSCWMHEYPPAVGVFLETVKQTPFLVGVLLTEGQFGAGGPVIRGMCALILGLSAMYAPAGSPVDGATLKKAIHSQITVVKYIQALEGLIASLKATNRNGVSNQVLSFTVPAWWLEWLEIVVGEIGEEIAGAPKMLTTGQQQSIIADGRTVAGTHASLAQMPQRAMPAVVSPSTGTGAASYTTLQQQNQSPKHIAVSPRQATVPVPNNIGTGTSNAVLQFTSTAASMTTSGKAPVLSTESNESAVVASLREEIADLKVRNAELEQEATRAKSAMVDAQQALTKVEADLEALSSAYASLDTHANDLQSKLDSTTRDGTTVGNNAVDYAALLQKAKEEAEADASAAMEDLLVCLGQQEEKIAELEAQLQATRTHTVSFL